MAEIYRMIQFWFSVTEAGGRLDCAMEPMHFEMCVFISSHLSLPPLSSLFFFS